MKKNTKASPEKNTAARRAANEKKKLKAWAVVLIVIGALIALTALWGLYTSIHIKIMTKTSERAENLTLSSVPDYKSRLELVWADEFTGDELPDHWVILKNNSNASERQTYTDAVGPDGNIIMDGENLVIRGKKETLNGRTVYSSAKLTTQTKAIFRYGYYEMRAKLPNGQGYWPAFWMMGQKPMIPEIPGTSMWPYAGEIDIMESIGAKEDNRIAHSDFHWVNSLYEKYARLNQCYHGRDFFEMNQYVLANDTFQDDYHTFGMAWGKNLLAFYVDDTLVHSFDITSDDFSCFRSGGWYFLLNLAIGGEWPGNPDDTTPFPADFVIDYVRVWQ